MSSRLSRPEGDLVLCYRTIWDLRSGRAVVVEASLDEFAKGDLVERQLYEVLSFGRLRHTTTPSARFRWMLVKTAEEFRGRRVAAGLPILGISCAGAMSATVLDVNWLLGAIRAWGISPTQLAIRVRAADLVDQRPDLARALASQGAHLIVELQSPADLAVLGNDTVRPSMVAFDPLARAWNGSDSRATAESLKAAADAGISLTVGRGVSSWEHATRLARAGVVLQEGPVLGGPHPSFKLAARDELDGYVAPIAATPRSLDGWCRPAVGRGSTRLTTAARSALAGAAHNPTACAVAVANLRSWFPTVPETLRPTAEQVVTEVCAAMSLEVTEALP